jgi:hypothetical protein
MFPYVIFKVSVIELLLLFKSSHLVVWKYKMAIYIYIYI